jgi:mRNA-degrading endonuclease RelE of RelBE toxin-antitoxin system
MKYRLSIGRSAKNELKRLPQDVLVQLNEHLRHLAELAGHTAGTYPIWADARNSQPSLLRFELRDFSILYEIDHPSRSIRVRSVARTSPASSEDPPAPWIDAVD